MAAPNYKAFSVQLFTDSGGDNNIQVPWPSGASTGDIGLLVIDWGGNFASQEERLCSVDQDWEEITSAQYENTDGYEYNFQLFWKRHTGSETSPTATWPVTLYNTSERARMMMYTFDGAMSSGNPWSTAALAQQTGDGSDTTLTSAESAAAWSNDALGLIISNGNTPAVMSTPAPSGFTFKYNYSAGGSYLGVHEGLATYDTDLALNGTVPATGFSKVTACVANSHWLLCSLVLHSQAAPVTPTTRRRRFMAVVG